MDRNETIVAAGILVLASYYFISKDSEIKMDIEESDYRDFRRITELQGHITKELKSAMEGIDLESSLRERQFPKGNNIIQVARRLKKSLEAVDNELTNIEVSSSERQTFNSVSDQLHTVLDQIIKVGEPGGDQYLVYNIAEMRHDTNHDNRQMQFNQRISMVSEQHPRPMAVEVDQFKFGAFTDRFSLNEGPGVAVDQAPGAFMQIEGVNDNRKQDQLVATTENAGGLNENGPPALGTSVKRLTDRDTSTGGFAPEKRTRISKDPYNAQNKPRVSAYLKAPPAKVPQKPERIVPLTGGGGDASPNFNPSNSPAAADDSIAVLENVVASTAFQNDPELAKMLSQHRVGKAPGIKGMNASIKRLESLTTQLNKVITQDSPTEENQSRATLLFGEIQRHHPAGIVTKRPFYKVNNTEMLYRPGSGDPSEDDVKARVDFQLYQKVISLYAAKLKSFQAKRMGDAAGIEPLHSNNEGSIGGRAKKQKTKGRIHTGNIGWTDELRRRRMILV